MPSTEKNKFLFEKILIEYNNKKVKIDIYDTPLGKRFIDALRDNLQQKRILEKNFCFLGFADSNRDLRYLVQEVNKNITQINTFIYLTVKHPFAAKISLIKKFHD